MSDRTPPRSTVPPRPPVPPMGGSAPPPPRAPRRPGLFELLGDLPNRVTELVQREIDLVKAEVTAKLKALGIGAGLLVAAAVVLLFMVGTLLTAAILGLSLVMPGWLAALLVSAALLLIAAILGLVGYGAIKRGVPPVPTESIESLKRDLRAIQGIGKRGDT